MKENKGNKKRNVEFSLSYYGDKFKKKLDDQIEELEDWPTTYVLISSVNNIVKRSAIPLSILRGQTSRNMVGYPPTGCFSQA